MPPAISESEFNAEIEALGFRVVRPGDADFVVWGYVDIGDGVVVDRWRGGATLAAQLQYLKQQKPAAAKPKKKSGGKKDA
jgi:hypothetical protein